MAARDAAQRPAMRSRCRGRRSPNGRSAQVERPRFRAGGAHSPRREETASVTAFTEIRKGVNGKPSGTNASAGDKQNFRDPDIWGAGVKVNQVALWGAEQTISSTPEAPAHLARTFLAAAYQTLAVDSGRSNVPSGRVLEGEGLCAAPLPSRLS